MKSSHSQSAAQLKTTEMKINDQHKDLQEVQELLVDQVVLVIRSSPACSAHPGKRGEVGRTLPTGSHLVTQPPGLPLNLRDKILTPLRSTDETHLSARLPSVSRRTPQSLRPLDACAATDPLDPLSTRRPRCTRLTLEPHEDAGRRASKVKGHTDSQHAINTSHLSALNNCFQLRPFVPLICLSAHTHTRTHASVFSFKWMEGDSP